MLCRVLKTRPGIAIENSLSRSNGANGTIMKPNHRLAERPNGTRTMTYKKYRAAPTRYILHLAQTFLLETRVPNRQYLIHDENLRLQMSRDRERESNIHSTAVALHRCIEELFYLSKSDDLVKAFGDIVSGHAKNRPIEIYILT